MPDASDQFWPPLKVLIIGGSGVFGSRLARILVRDCGVAVTLAGRRLAALQTTAASLESPASICVLDRDTLTCADLAPFDWVVDAAGPFQSSHTRVIEAAIAARIGYCDLADGREFVARFPRFDAAARSAGVSLITGASSIPALSHAMIDAMVADWSVINDITIGIFPGNRAPRGRSVVDAILSYVGKPVRVFRDGKWTRVSGWGMTHRQDIGGVDGRKKRWASVCDTPEQDLLVARYRPTRSAQFFAGLELGILHLGLAFLAQLVRFKLLPGLQPFASAMLWIAERLLPFGSDRGAMVVNVRGADSLGNEVRKKTILNADSNLGPNVPITPVVALIRRIRQGWVPAPGAYPCSGIVRLSEFEAIFHEIGISLEFLEARVDNGTPAVVQ